MITQLLRESWQQRSSGRRKLSQSFRRWNTHYADLLPSLRDFFVGDYIVFYFPKQNSIQVIRVLSGYRNLEAIFLESSEGIGSTEDA